MDPIFKFPASPGTPLFPVSPERANRQQLPQSPSLPHLSHVHNDPFVAHSRGNSDVQGKVAQFNNLSKEAAQRRKDNEAALKRAVLGREEAESESRRLKEENRVLRLDVEEGRARERKVGERMEAVMEQLQRTNETHAHSQSIYEKEVRRARKEAFKSSSALVKMQEELKSARNKYTLMREEVDVQRRKVGAKEQENFVARSMLVDLQEEVERLKQQNKVVEGQRDALKTALKGEEVARIAAEGTTGRPATSEDNEFASPKKSSRHRHRDSLKENVDPEAPDLEDELLILKEELRMEKRMRSRADDQIHFMKMECQFQCCSCRVAEKQGTDYVHDDSLAIQMGDMAVKVEDGYVPAPEAIPEPVPVPVPEPTQSGPSTPEPQPLQERDIRESPLVDFSPTTGTFHTVPSPTKPTITEPLLDRIRPSTPPAKPLRQQASSPASPPQPTVSPTQSTIPASPPFPQETSIPQTPRPLPYPPAPVRTISHTTTTKLPLKEPSIDDIPAPMTPGGISREEALERIRQRRGRARSVAVGGGIGTPRRVGEGKGEGGRRDCSAPAGRV